MTNILMWLFANDFGLFSNVMKFTLLFFFIIFELIMFMLHRYVKRMLFTLFAICLVFICCFFCYIYLFQNFPRIYSTIWNGIAKRNVITLS